MAAGCVCGGVGDGSATVPVGRDERLLEGLGFFSKKEVHIWEPDQHVNLLWAAPEGQGEPVLIWMGSISRLFSSCC